MRANGLADDAFSGASCAQLQRFHRKNGKNARGGAFYLYH
jgi:hypothetical protein